MMTTMNGDDSPTYVRRLAALAQEDPQLNSLLPDMAVEATLATAGITFARAVATALDGYASRPALAERDYDVVCEPESGRAVKQPLPRFCTITYRELRRRVEALACAWRYMDAWGVEPGDFVSIVGFNGIDYVTVDLACLFVQGVSVPLQSAAGRPALEQIFTDTAPTVVAVTAREAEFVAELVATQRSVRALIVFDYDERVDDDREAYAAARAVLTHRGAGARLVTLDELIAAGNALEWEPPPDSAQGGDRVAMLVHSSGTTGTPKGAILFDRHARSSLAPAVFAWPRVRLCFAPMNHTMGRGTVYGTMAHGGTAYFATESDMSTLFEDIRLVRPTDGFFFPRALEMVYRRYKSAVTLRMSEANLKEDAARAEVLAEMRNWYLGDRLCMIKGGSAPTLPEVRRFVTEGLQIEFIDRYGSTEAGAITVNDRVRRPAVIDYRLRDVPELGYFTTDKPHPRGELCVKTTSMISGYFKRPEATAKLFDSDGFVLTGDIMEERGPDHLMHIDRRNDVLKLAQGEFVAAGALGTVFENGSDLIQQIHVHGNSVRSYLLAVVVPNMDVARATLGHEPDEMELRALIATELKRVGATGDLKTFEIPRDFIVETEPFSQANGLLTALRKRIRPALQRKYGDHLEQLYANVECIQAARLGALRSKANDLSVTEKIGKALEAFLGVDNLDVSQPHSFAQLGGDSLGAVGFAALIEDIFGVELPVNTILSPTGNPKQWARKVEATLADGSHPAPNFVTVHGEGSRHLDAADLDLATFLDPAVLNGTPDAPAADSRTVLLTGATGFLGRFVCLEWLEKFAAEGGKLICFVRAPDHATAARRLDAIFAGIDPQLEERYRAFAKDHLEVLAGDVTEVGLGLSDIEYERLAIEVDRIVHSAALVNHVLDYESLFASNVTGTAALISLAMTARQKAFDFVSSTAVSRLLDRRERNDEDSPLMMRATLSGAYANGYSTSKWAAEHLLRAAGDVFGLPVNVFRGTMMLPHRRFLGQINLDDIFTRLLFSVIVTGIAPESFYVASPGRSRPKAHYDGLPVDFIASAIVRIGSKAHEGVRTFNVANHHADDGLSLDVFVDWIMSQGYPITHVADYEEWFASFEAALHALPESRRQLSSLPVLDSLRQPSAAGKPLAGSRNFDESLLTFDIGPKTPQLTREYIGKCLNDMHHHGLVHMPERIETAERA